MKYLLYVFTITQLGVAGSGLRVKVLGARLIGVGLTLRNETPTNRRLSPHYFYERCIWKVGGVRALAYNGHLHIAFYVGTYLRLILDFR